MIKKLSQYYWWCRCTHTYLTIKITQSNTLQKQTRFQRCKFTLKKKRSWKQTGNAIEPRIRLLKGSILKTLEVEALQVSVRFEEEVGPLAEVGDLWMELDRVAVPVVPQALVNWQGRVNALVPNAGVQLKSNFHY